LSLTTEHILDLMTGARVAVFQTGRGPDLLYLPGSNVDYRLRRGVFESLLPEHFRVTTLEHRGLARSTGPGGPWQMQDFAEDVLQVMTELGIPTALLLGESFGAMVAQWVALAAPDRFSQVALACGSAGGAAGSSFPFHEWLDQSATERARQVLLHINLGHQAIEVSNPTRFNQMVDGRVMFETKFLAGLAQQDGYQRLLMARAGHDCSTQLQGLTMPVLVMAGRQDGIAPLANQTAMVSRMSDARLAEFDGGHDFLWAGPKPITWLLQQWVSAP
jgi:3-oxoadipate enol-lactonase